MLSLSTRPSSVWPSVVWTVLRTTTGGATRESGAGATGPFGAWATAAATARTKHDAKVSVFMVPKTYQVLRRVAGVLSTTEDLHLYVRQCQARQDRLDR